jgi:hypothetical protein
MGIGEGRNDDSIAQRSDCEDIHRIEVFDEYFRAGFRRQFVAA